MHTKMQDNEIKLKIVSTQEWRNLMKSDLNFPGAQVSSFEYCSCVLNACFFFFPRLVFNQSKCLLLKKEH